MISLLCSAITLLGLGGWGAVAAAARRLPGANWFPRPAVLTGAEHQDFDLVNADRAQAGVGPVETSAALQAIAERRVLKMAARNSDYAGYDVAVDIKRARLCSRGNREIEDQLQGGGGDYPEIELDPRWTVFAVAIYTDATGTYEVEDYAAPCGLKRFKPLALPKASAVFEGLAVSVGAPAADAPLYPVGETINSPVACNPAAGLYAVVRYSGSPSGYFYGIAIPGGPIDQPARPGSNAVLLATDLGAGPYSFAFAVEARIRLPDGDRIAVQLPTGPFGGKFITLSATAEDCIEPVEHAGAHGPAVLDPRLRLCRPAACRRGSCELNRRQNRPSP